MIIKQALAEARRILEAKDINSGNLDSILLLCHSLNSSKEKIIFNPDLALDSEEEKLFFDLISRRAQYEPVAHIIGYKEFFGENFIVNNHVLTPRPDSETLIELVLEKFPQKDKALGILEIGSGSGCLAITLLRLYQNSQVVAADISKEALEITKKNSILCGVENRLSPVLSDLFDNIKNKKFDLIISNPPYIPTKEISDLQMDVKNYEPITALDGGHDGLDFYRKIASAAKVFLEKNAKIILEIGRGQEQEIIEIFEKNNFIFDCQKLDLSGIIRILSFKC